MGHRSLSLHCHGPCCSCRNSPTSNWCDPTSASVQSAVPLGVWLHVFATRMDRTALLVARSSCDRPGPTAHSSTWNSVRLMTVCAQCTFGAGDVPLGRTHARRRLCWHILRGDCHTYHDASVDKTLQTQCSTLPRSASMLQHGVPR